MQHQVGVVVVRLEEVAEVGVGAAHLLALAAVVGAAEVQLKEVEAVAEVVVVVRHSILVLRVLVQQDEVVLLGARWEGGQVERGVQRLDGQVGEQVPAAAQRVEMVPCVEVVRAALALREKLLEERLVAEDVVEAQEVAQEQKVWGAARYLP